MESSIFLNDLTVIDYSTITNDGTIIGGSSTLNLEVTGNVDSHEGVVIDFSACKKRIKQFIDGRGGFDHKLWVNLDDPQIVVDVDGVYTTVSHRASGLTITAEPDAFAWVGYTPTQDIADFLNHHLAPYTVSRVALNNDTIPPLHTNTESCEFRYVHGLKNSSSFGCKNLVHGHLSYVSAVVPTNDVLVATNQWLGQPPNEPTAANLVLRGIAADLNNCIFAHAEDIKSTDGGVYKIAYSTDERGDMSMSFTQKLIVLETQTTVEHIVEYVRARYYDQLKAAGVTELYVSEGLCKGARVTV